MSLSEETIDATLDSNGHLQLLQTPRLPAGPVRVTIRVAPVAVPPRQLSDAVSDIVASQRARGFGGRSAEEMHADEDARNAEDTERDRELDAARRNFGAP